MHKRTNLVVLALLAGPLVLLSGQEQPERPKRFYRGKVLEAEQLNEEFESLDSKIADLREELDQMRTQPVGLVPARLLTRTSDMSNPLDKKDDAIPRFPNDSNALALSPGVWLLAGHVRMHYVSSTSEPKKDSPGFRGVGTRWYLRFNAQKHELNENRAIPASLAPGLKRLEGQFHQPGALLLEPSNLHGFQHTLSPVLIELLQPCDLILESTVSSTQPSHGRAQMYLTAQRLD